MIEKILRHYTARLDEHLRRKFPRPEGVAEVGFTSNRRDEEPCKLIVSLVNIERETTGDIPAAPRRDDTGHERSSPLLLLNLYLLFAAMYDENRYEESLSVLFETLAFIQSNSRFELEGQTYTIEIVTLPVQDMNNICTMLGRRYYPSVTCKLQRLIVDAR